jgi:hypothetical protein
MLAHEVAERAYPSTATAIAWSRAPRRYVGSGFARNDGTAPKNVPLCEVRPVRCGAPGQFRHHDFTVHKHQEQPGVVALSTTGPASYTSMRALAQLRELSVGEPFKQEQRA